MRTILTTIAVLLMAGCAAPRHEYYEAQNAAREQSAARDMAKTAALATAAAGCESDLCRVSVAGFAALEKRESVAPAQQYRSAAGPVLDLVGKALGIGAQVYGAQVQGETLVDLAGVIAGSAGDRSTHSFIDQSDHSTHDDSTHGSFNDSSDNSTTGDTISDSGNTPTTIDVSGDGSSVGDGNSVNNGDNNDNSGDLRDESAGPIDDNSNSGDCDGAGNCAPEPIDP